MGLDREIKTDLCLGRMRCRISERDEHDTRDVDHLTVDVEHPRRRLQLRLQSMGRRTHHHQRPSELEDKVLSGEDGRDVHRDLSTVTATKHDWVSLDGVKDGWMAVRND